MIRRADEGEMTGPIRPLTARQAEVVDALVRGLSYRAIGDELGMAERTAEAHVHAIAMLLPNPHGLPARALVERWALQARAA